MKTPPTEMGQWGSLKRLKFSLKTLVLDRPGEFRSENRQKGDFLVE